MCGLLISRSSTLGTLENGEGKTLDEVGWRDRAHFRTLSSSPSSCMKRAKIEFPAFQPCSAIWRGAGIQII